MLYVYKDEVLSSLENVRDHYSNLGLSDSVSVVDGLFSVVNFMASGDYVDFSSFCFCLLRDVQRYQRSDFYAGECACMRVLGSVNKLGKVEL